MELNQLEFYETTSIKKLLSLIGPKNSPSIAAWKEKVGLAVKNCNQQKYEELIKPV